MVVRLRREVGDRKEPPTGELDLVVAGIGAYDRSSTIESLSLNWGMPVASGPSGTELRGWMPGHAQITMRGKTIERTIRDAIKRALTFMSAGARRRDSRS
jgi:hypothetical protein